MKEILLAARGSALLWKLACVFPKTKPRKRPKFSSLAHYLQLLYSEWKACQRTTVREPVRLAQSPFPCDFHETKCSIRQKVLAREMPFGENSRLKRKHPEKFKIFFTRAFGARGSPTVTFDGRHAKRQPVVSPCDWCSLRFHAVFVELNAVHQFILSIIVNVAEIQKKAPKQSTGRWCKFRSGTIVTLSVARMWI